MQEVNETLEQNCVGLTVRPEVVHVRLVMLSELTTKDVENFEFIEITPAGGKAYYSGDLDVAVIHYGDYLRVYYDRVIEHGKTASSFNKSIINRTPSTTTAHSSQGNARL